MIIEITAISAIIIFFLMTMYIIGLNRENADLRAKNILLEYQIKEVKVRWFTPDLNNGSNYKKEIECQKNGMD